MAEAEAEADRVTSAAREEADQLRSEAQSEAEQARAELEESRKKGNDEIARLRETEQEHRDRMRDHLNEMLSGSTPPASSAGSGRSTSVTAATVTECPRPARPPGRCAPSR